MGAWCRFISETTDTNKISVCCLPVKSRNTTTISESTLDPWITVISCSSKKKKNTATCNTCQLLFLWTTPSTDSTCHWCCPENTVVQILHKTENSITEPSYVAELEEKKFLEPVDIPEDPPNDCSNQNTEIVPTITSPPIKNKSTLFCDSLQDHFFHFGSVLPGGLTAHITPMSNPAWQHSCRYLQSDPGLYYSGHTSHDDHFKVIWDTGASEVITSDPSDFIGGYTKPSSPLRLHGISSGTLVEGIGLIEYCLQADDHSVLTVCMKAYYMPGSLPQNIKLLPPQRLCLVSGGDFITTGTTACVGHQVDGNGEWFWGDDRIGDGASEWCKGRELVKRRSYNKVEGDETRCKGEGEVFSAIVLRRVSATTHFRLRFWQLKFAPIPGQWFPTVHDNTANTICYM